MNREEFVRALEKFTEGNDFRLNPDQKFLDMVIDGVMDQEEKNGFKFCPCRLRDGTKERDLALLCPCNFEIQETWKEQGRCWCGLFVKR